MKNVFLITIIVAVLTGCAGAKVYSDSALKNETGIPFYTAKPYLLVEKNGQKDVPMKVSVIYLPDLTDKRYVKVKRGIGSANLKMDLENSILKSYGLETDSKVPELVSSIGKIPVDLLNAVATMKAEKATPAEKDGKAPVDKQPEPSFELYEIKVDGSLLRIR